VVGLERQTGNESRYKMKILAFDLGGTFGWCLIREIDPFSDICQMDSTLFEVDDQAFEFSCGEVKLKEKDRPARMHEFANWIVAFMLAGNNEDLKCVVYERPFSRGLDATRCLWGYAGVLESMAHAYELPVLDQVPSPIKKFMTGSGKAKKLEMIAAAQKMVPSVKGEHEADAVALAWYAINNVKVG
jgi:Holliday junction resolvasome RuvABC endonuclease subunit